MGTQASGDRPRNRLAEATSPYLQQHAGNPVDWYPWGEEALARARAEQKPIFLSIGYSACHWCHVMERESFESEAIATELNRNFVNIKVDREERPDLDEIYMAAVQMMTGQGGWPMSVFLTPELEPFFGGTYFPPDDRYGRPGFGRLIEAIAKAWAERREEVVHSAGRMAEAIRGMAAVPEGNGLLLREVVDGAISALTRSFDRTWGGFGGAPKFPHTVAVQLLLRQYLRTRESRLLEMATVTLDRMAAGGMYDHIGGGFHRYSTDERWLVPHFEKMLYDQALLVLAYLEGYQVSRNPGYAVVARETCDYVLRDLRDPQGGFYSSEDADSEGEEGTFYIWTPDQLSAVLGPVEAELFAAAFDVDPAGNFEGRSILHPVMSLAALAERFQRSEDAVLASLREGRVRLFAAREGRERPFRDDKVVTAWNGLMISALARAARVLDAPEFLDAAREAVGFLLGTVERDGVLHRVWRAGKLSQPGYLDDYSHLIGGLVDLYEASGDEAYLRHAERLADRMQAEFGDPEGGFFVSGARHTGLIARLKHSQDGSVPSGNSMAAYALLRLGRLLGRDDLEQLAEATLRHFQTHLERAPGAFHQMVLALDLHLGERQEIVLVGEVDECRALGHEVDQRLLPYAVLTRSDGTGSLPLHEGKTRVNGRAAAYLCRNMTCGAPLVEPEALAKALEG